MKQLRVFMANVGRRTLTYPLATPPLGIMYIAAYLRSKMDVEVRIENQRLHNVSDKALVNEIADFRPDVVGLGALTPVAHSLTAVCKLVREALPKALIVIGGPHVTAVGATALHETGADVAVQGEGELVFEMIVRAWRDGDGFADIPGLLWRNSEGEAVTNPGLLPFIEDVDTLPFPAYDLIDLPAYWHHQSMPPIPRRKYATLFSSRGCPYRCKWCHNVFGKKFRPHSAERIVEEMAHYQKVYGVPEVEFIDDIFNYDRQRVFSVCDLLAKRETRCGIAFPNAIRADILDATVIDALKDAGMYFSSFAIESGSPRIQEAMGKRLNIPRALESIEYAARKRIYTNGFMMMGFPTETEEEMQQTIDVASSSMLHTASFFTVTPFPNTEIYDMYIKQQSGNREPLKFTDMNFCLFSGANLSAVPDEVLFRYQRMANRRFFVNPNRIYRLIRDYPQPHLLPLYLYIFLARNVKGLLSQ